MNHFHQPKSWLTITIVFSLLILQALGQPAFLKDGLVAYYPFNGNANDASGNGKNGVVQGPVSTTDRFGSQNSAYYFNGAGAPYHPDTQLPKPQRITSQLNQNFNNGITFSAWVLADSVQKSGDNYVFGVGSNSNRRYGLSSVGEVGGKKVTTPGFRSISAEYTSQSGYKVTPSVWGPNPQTEYNPANNQWLHIVYIASNTLKIFINGVEKDSQSVGGPTGEAITSIVLGDFEDPISGRCWQGKIDDVRIYNRALSAGEVKSLYDYELVPAVQSPVLVAQPQTQSVTAGDDATFCITLKDFGTYNYQWQLNEQNIAGATLNCYTVNSLTVAMNGGRYRVIVSNAAGTVVSESAVLSVRSPEPYLSDGLVSYIAFDSNLNDSAQNANKLIASSKVSLVANRFGNVQSALQLESVNSYVTYTTNRLPQKNEDRSYSIWVLKNRDWNTVGGTGWGPILSYVGEWQKGQPWLEAYNNSSGSWVRFVGDVKTNPEAFSTAFVPQSYDSWQNIIVTYKSPLLKIYINGVLRSSKNIPQLSSIVTGPLMIGNINHPFPGIVDDFRCYNRELSALEVISLYDYEKPIDMPQIFTQPKDLVVQVNAAAEFCVGMSDNRLYKYQWQMDSKDIIDQTNMCLTINSAGSEFNGRRFRVIVSNTQGVVTSDPVSLTVVTPQPPSIATQPIGKTVQEGSNASFAVVATGQGSLVYQWQLNEQNLPGATSATLNLNGVKQNQSGRYRVLVSSPYGVTISDTVSLIVNANPPPTIVTQPISKTPAEGTQVSLTVTATGLGALTYQWQVNNQNIPGATSSTLVLSAVRPSANGNYRVIVGNPYGTTISTEATVTVVVTDADSDGLSDYEELLFGTNINKADSDGDGLSDFAEVKTHGSNPLTTDTDGDGYSDGIEVARDGNPNNRSATPTGALAVFPAVDVEFYTLNGVKYQLEVSTDMAVWTAQGGVVVGNGGSQNHLVRAGKATQFWRLKVVQ